MPTADQIARFRRDVEALTGAPAPRLAVAVSGGPDSLALLLLAATAYPDGIVAATVDHGLRTASADEAALVARHCGVLRIPHETLVVEVRTRGEGLQAAARTARYAALSGWLAERGCDAVLTGHHVDDQAETLLMRLERGSGVAGLAGIRASVPLPGGGTALRPLLGWRRAELASIVAAAGLEVALDPSNLDQRYGRTRVRRHLAQSAWIDPPALARSAAALADAEDALHQWTCALAETRIARQGGAVRLDIAGLPAEIARRLVLRCLEEVSPGARPRGEQVAALLGTLAQGETATLAGAKCIGGATYRFVAAAPRTGSKGR